MMNALNRDHNLITLSAMGAPRPNLALDLLRAVRERSGEIEECRLTPVGDRMILSVVVSGNWSTVNRLEAALPSISERLGIAIRCERSAARPMTPDARPYAVDVIAPQHPDLLPSLVAFFDEQGTQIVEINTLKYASNYTGAGMVSVQMVAHVPVDQHPQALRDAFMDLCDDLNADGVLDPIKT